MNRLLASSLIAILFAAAGGVAVYFALAQETKEPVIVIESMPTVERVTEIGELCVLKVQVTDMLQATTPSLKASWLITGDALISVDLEDVRINRLDRDGKRLVLSMPPLQLLSPRVNHEKTRHWDTKSVCWHNGWFTYDKIGKSSRMQQAAMRKAQQTISLVSQDSEYVEQARQSAEQIISALYTETGYSVSFDWPDKPGYEPEARGTLLSAAR
ncbi:MAG: hypothetical protein CMJ78_00370 [Planctomycetaceae bacterium]|nr:hypothetical protein [Planctomycetaceae bacterium]